MIRPIRIQRSRQHKQTSPNGLPIVYVGRPSKYKNPFPVNGNTTLEKSLELYIDHLTLNFTEDEVKRDLKGKNLSCWRKPGDKCHADILLNVANNTKKP